MNRTYHSRMTWQALAGALVTALLSLAFFWQRQGLTVLLGVAMAVLTVIQIERIIHTTYMLTDDGWLVVSAGRFARTRRIRIGDIWRVRQCRRLFGMVHYVLVEYGDHHHVALMPGNELLLMRDIILRMQGNNDDL